jgi:phosphatidylinositol 4-kinase type 2
MAKLSIVTLSSKHTNESGWLFLPVSLIGRPFSQKTRDHFIPLLTSAKWWQETSKLLHALFEKDDDFQERMFAKQLAVLKGQAWNILETLKQPDQGPLELCRRQCVLVNDEEMEVPVAVPMTVPASKSPQFHEEMDIAALGDTASSAPPPQIRLSRTPESRHLHPIMDDFDNDLPRSSLDDYDIPGRTSNIEEMSASFLSEDLNRPKRSTKPHSYYKKTRNRMSYEGPSRPLLSSGRRRGFSVSDTNPLLDEEDEERDLGFAAAQDEEALRKKVIVEKYHDFDFTDSRMEIVKSRNPVFSWC